VDYFKEQHDRFLILQRSFDQIDLTRDGSNIEERLKPLLDENQQLKAEMAY
jgi:hypothetical protein